MLILMNGNCSWINKVFFIINQLIICIIFRIQSVLAQPLPVRCDTISQLVEECTNKELDTLFTTLVDDIFGITNQIGWGLRSIQHNTHSIEYDMLYKFLHPHGPVFRLCYKLLADCYRKYEYQLIFLPVSQIQYIYKAGFDII